MGPAPVVFAMISLAAISLAACAKNSSSAATTTTLGSTTVVANPSVSITPATGLADQQTVTVNGTGYPPREQLQLIECGGALVAQEGKPVGDNCASFEKKNVTANSMGNVTTTFKVYKGPIGGAYVLCTQAPGCVIFLGQAGTDTPNALAFAKIAFAS